MSDNRLRIQLHFGVQILPGRVSCRLRIVTYIYCSVDDSYISRTNLFVTQDSRGTLLDLSSLTLFGALAPHRPEHSESTSRKVSTVSQSTSTSVTQPGLHLLQEHLYILTLSLSTTFNYPSDRALCAKLSNMDTPMTDAVSSRKPIPEIDFTLHTMEDGSQVSTQERVCKGIFEI